MTIKQRIDKFVKKYPEPYQFAIRLVWERKGGIHEHTYFPNNDSIHGCWRTPHIVTRRVGRDMIVQHYRYDEKLELLELAYAIFDCHTPKSGENRRWTYGCRYFVPKDTRELYNISGGQNNYVFMMATYSQDTYSPIALVKKFTTMGFNKEMFHKEFLSFAGNNLQTSSSWKPYITNESHPWQLASWFAYQPKNKTTGGVQKLIDELSAKTSDVPKDIITQIECKMTENKYYGKYAWFDIDNKAFRCFVQSKDGLLEDKRVYVADKNKYAVATINPAGEWVTNGSFTSNRFNFNIINKDDVYKLPHREYIKNIFQDREPTVYRFVSMMKTPEIEQLANMGMYAIVKHLSGQDNVAAHIKELFGAPNKKKNVLAKYSMNKKQMEYVNIVFDDSESSYQYGYYNKKRGISAIKRHMGIDNVASLDYNTFLKYYKFASRLGWSEQRMIERIPEDRRQKVVCKLCNMYDKHDTVLTLFSDTVSSYNYLNAENRPNVDVYDLKSYKELVRLHDTVIELRRLEQEERQRLYNMKEAERHALLEKKMEKLDKKRAEFNYSDDDFTIRLPNKLSEIVNEGSMLHHCVAGYTDRHAEGRTTIMFLRKNNDPTTSFYTIEINNDNTIQQIHGFGNKWLGNNPEAIPTVMRWLRANNLHCSDNILLSTAKGYCSGNAPLVNKPII